MEDGKSLVRERTHTRRGDPCVYMYGVIACVRDCVRACVRACGVCVRALHNLNSKVNISKEIITQQ